MRLENYIMEQDINTASVADIFVEQAQAEFDVAMALLDSSIKDLTFQEFYIVQEGELGTAVSDARAEVRSDGKKHHIKAAIAAIKAFFKFVFTKIGSFFHKNTTDAAVVDKNMKQIMDMCSDTMGSKCDVKLPYTKEQFGKIYSFYDGMNEEIEEIVASANFLTRYVRKVWDKEAGTQLENGEFIKRINRIESFIEKTKDAANITKIESVDYKKRVEELNKKRAAGGAFTAADKRALKAARKQLVPKEDSTPEPVDDGKMPSLEIPVLVVKAGEDETFIGYAEYQKFRSLLESVKNTWNSKKKEIEKDIKTLDKMDAENITGGAAMEKVKPMISKLQAAVVGMIKPADDIISKCKQLTTKALTKSGVLKPALTRADKAGNDATDANLTDLYNSFGYKDAAAKRAGVGINQVGRTDRAATYLKNKQDQAANHTPSWDNVRVGSEPKNRSLGDKVKDALG